MDKTLRFEPEVEVWNKLGRPVNERGYFISSSMPSPEFIDKAIETMQRLFSFLDEVGVSVMEDSEQGSVLVIFPDDPFNVEYTNGADGVWTNIWVVDNNGYRAGGLVEQTDANSSDRRTNR